MEDQDQQQPFHTPTAGVPISNIPSSGPAGPGQKKKVSKWLLIIIALILIGIGGGLFVIGALKKEEEPEPTPASYVEGLSAFDDFEATPEPSEETQDKAEVTIEILNGTGIAGEASFLESKLTALGYEEIEIGNASSQDYSSTQVTFSSSLSEDLIEEITDELEDIYEKVKTTTSRSTTLDVQIITGLRKGQTPKPSGTTEPESTATPTSTPTPTPAATPET